MRRGTAGWATWLAARGGKSDVRLSDRQPLPCRGREAAQPPEKAEARPLVDGGELETRWVASHANIAEEKGDPTSQVGESEPEDSAHPKEMSSKPTLTPCTSAIRSAVRRRRLRPRFSPEFEPRRSNLCPSFQSSATGSLHSHRDGTYNFAPWCSCGEHGSEACMGHLRRGSCRDLAA